MSLGWMSAVLESRIVEIAAGGAIAIFFGILVEKFRKPNLFFEIESPIDRTYSSAPAGATRWLRIYVRAKPLPWPLRWMLRHTAARCRALITFHHLDGTRVFSKEMKGRWSSSPEPARIAISGGITTDVALALATPRIDIDPGETETLDVAVRFDNEVECYGWCNESYLHGWRHPDWKLSANRFLVRIVVMSGGQKWPITYRLHNDTSRKEFRLESATATEQFKVAEHD